MVFYQFIYGKKFKQGHKKRFGTHRSLFATYLSDFLWRKEFGGHDIFYNFWSQIAQLYPQIDDLYGDIVME